MHRFFHRNWLYRRFAWLVLGVALGLALGPTVSKMLAERQGFDPVALAQMEVCSAAGASTVMPDFPADQNQDNKQRAACPLCYVQAHSPALPIQTLVIDAPPKGAHLLVLGGGTTVVFKSAYYRLRHSRAPPALS